MNKMRKNDIEIKKEIYSLIKGPFEIFDNFIYHDYVFVTEDYKTYLAKFEKKDFLHLIGISVYPMNERKFYDDYKDGKANYGVINLNKTYNRTTINKKISVINNLQAFIDNKLDGENLVIEDFKTLTAENEIFKYALRNDDRRYTLGFGIHNNAKSTRLELASVGTIRQKVICVLRKNRDAKEYTELIYISKNESIQSILTKLKSPHHLTKDGCLILD